MNGLKSSNFGCYSIEQYACKTVINQHKKGFKVNYYFIQILTTGVTNLIALDMFETINIVTTINN